MGILAIFLLGKGLTKHAHSEFYKICTQQQSSYKQDAFLAGFTLKCVFMIATQSVSEPLGLFTIGSCILPIEHA